MTCVALRNAESFLYHTRHSKIIKFWRGIVRAEVCDFDTPPVFTNKKRLWNKSVDKILRFINVDTFDI